MTDTLRVIMDGGNKSYFESQVGTGYDLEKFIQSSDKNDYADICGLCGEPIDAIGRCSDDCRWSIGETQ